MTDCQEFWNMRSENYDTQIGPFYGAAYEKTVERTVKYLSQGDRVLDFACGTGIVTFRMAPCVDQIQGIDISDKMVRLAREKAEAGGVGNVKIDQMDLFSTCLEAESFDVVTAFNVICYLDNYKAALERIRDLLKPGGLFLSATDCLGEKITRVGIQKFWKSRTGAMPYVAFFRMKGLERAIADAGFAVLERENLFPAPPNLFVAARKEC